VPISRYSPLMGRIHKNFKCIVAAFLMSVMYSVPAVAQSDELDRLFTELANPDQQGWKMIEESIWREWSKSGSAAMDLLLQRGRKAMESGETDIAIEHFTALIDHAPDFAEGWNARATAYFSAGLYGPSIDDIRTTLELNPRHFGALSGLGIILDELGYHKEALEAYREVKKLNPNRPNLDDAIERLEKQVLGSTL
jgi:tetratricopeptide (TPR) repeat protein